MMENKKIYENIKDYKSKANKLYEVAKTNENELIHLSKEFIQSPPMKETFDGKDAEQYTEFEKAVLQFLGSNIKVFEKSQLDANQKEAVKSYKQLLESLNKD